ncbi:MAG: TIGR04086 family membrane protein [Clostridia bacterium]|nr:TIGR04086 family membrane protein [Clostridia bacterium]
MRKKIAKRKKELPVSTKNIIGILISNGIGFTSIIILTFISSLILTKSSALTNSVSIYFIGSVTIGSLITGFIASKKCTFKGFISGIIASLPLMFCVTVVMLVFSHGRLIPETAILYVGIIVFSAIGGIISANTKRRK